MGFSVIGGNGEDDCTFYQKGNDNKPLVFYVFQKDVHPKAAKHESCELREAPHP